MLSCYLQQDEVKSHPLSKRQTEQIVKQQDFFFLLKHSHPAWSAVSHIQIASLLYISWWRQGKTCWAVVPSESLLTYDVTLEERQDQSLLGMVGNIIRWYMMHWMGLQWSNKHVWQLNKKPCLAGQIAPSSANDRCRKIFILQRLQPNSWNKIAS